MPAVNSLLMLRPTESPLLFLQQLGRGLRKAPDKNLCTVLDFVGQHRKEFRYDRRFRALLGGSRTHVARQVAEGFPFLPSGLQHAARPRGDRARVGEHSLRAAFAMAGKSRRVAEPGSRAADYRPCGVSRVSRGWIWTTSIVAIDRGRICEKRPVCQWPRPDRRRPALVEQLGRLLHVDDLERLGAWSNWVRCGDSAGCGGALGA